MVVKGLDASDASDGAMQWRMKVEDGKRSAAHLLTCINMFRTLSNKTSYGFARVV